MNLSGYVLLIKILRLCSIRKRIKLFGMENVFDGFYWTMLIKPSDGWRHSLTKKPSRKEMINQQVALGFLNVFKIKTQPSCFLTPVKSGCKVRGWKPWMAQ